jgi:hypothetical protein
MINGHALNISLKRGFSLNVVLVPPKITGSHYNRRLSKRKGPIDWKKNIIR